ncbi:MAG: acyltransferase [Eubacterium sp.]|nr:acyltransferase [Eubacterium sp.]
MSTTDNRNGFVDFVKFVMALLIMWGHYDYIIGQEFESVSITKTLTEFAHENVTVIVCIFFFISGFFAWQFSYRKLSDGKTTIGPFVIKKIKRLYPLMAVSVVWFCAAELIYRGAYGHFWAGREVNLSNAILTALGINRWVSTAGGDINGPIWYVSVLMLCYIVFGIIAAFKLSDEYKTIIFAGMVVLGIISQLNELTFPLVADKVGRGYMCFFLGVCFAILFKAYPKYKNFWAAILAIVIYAIAITAKENYRLDLLGNKNIAAIFTLAPAFIVLGENGVFKKVFNNSLCEWLGRISYPMFLFHIPTYLTIGLFLRDGINYNSYLTIIIITLFVGAISFAAEKLQEMSNKR